MQAQNIRILAFTSLILCLYYQAGWKETWSTTAAFESGLFKVCWPMANNMFVAVYALLRTIMFLFSTTWRSPNVPFESGRGLCSSKKWYKLQTYSCFRVHCWRVPFSSVYGLYSSFLYALVWQVGKNDEQLGVLFLVFSKENTLYVKQWVGLKALRSSLHSRHSWSQLAVESFKQMVFGSKRKAQTGTRSVAGSIFSCYQTVFFEVTRYFRPTARWCGSRTWAFWSS